MSKDDKSKEAPSSAGGGGEKLRLYSLVCFSGAALMSFEIVASRILAPFFGSDVFVWGSLIGVFLAALSLGYLLGGRLADRRPRLELLAGLVIASGALILIVPMISNPICRSIEAAQSVGVAGPLVASLILFTLPSILMGMVSPFAIRLQAKSVAKMGNVAGRLYALSTFGSIVGTLGTTFLLIPYIRGGSTMIVRIVGLGMIFIAILSIIRRPSRAAASVLLAGLCYFGAARMHIPLVIDLDQEALGFQGYLGLEEKPQLLVRYRADSAYHNIIVLDAVPQESGAPKRGAPRSRYLLFNNRIESGIWGVADGDSVRAPRLFAEPYRTSTRYSALLHMGLIFNDHPKDVLFVGGGGGVAPMIFRQDYPWMNIEVVEIDPVVVEVARKYFGVPGSGADPQLVFHVKDGRTFIRNSPKKYDYIVLDAYTSGGRIPFHLVTKEFFAEVRDHLAPGGVVVANVISQLEEGPLYASIYKTLAEAFGGAYTFPNRLGDELRRKNLKDRINIILVATRDPMELSMDDIRERASALAKSGVVKIDKFALHAEHYYIIPERSLQKAVLLTDNYCPADALSYRESY